MTSYSPYQIAKLLNQKFVELGIVRVVPPQMMYNYCKNGLIDGQKRSSTAKVTFSEETVQIFLAKFLKKNYNVEMNVSSNKTEEIETNEEVEGQMDLIDSLVEDETAKLIMSQLPGSEN